MLSVSWRPLALDALVSIVSYIEQFNATAADNLKTEIEDTTEALIHHPYLYKKGRVVGTREIVVHPNYIVVYKVTESVIYVLNVLHSRQNYP